MRTGAGSQGTAKGRRQETAAEPEGAMGQMDRRDFGRVLAAGVAGALAAPSARGASPVGPGGGLTEGAGVKVGHFTDSRRPTGCTVVLTEEGAGCGGDVRGGAPGTPGPGPLAPL